MQDEPEAHRFSLGCPFPYPCSPPRLPFDWVRLGLKGGVLVASMGAVYCRVSYSASSSSGVLYAIAIAYVATIGVLYLRLLRDTDMVMGALGACAMFSPFAALLEFELRVNRNADVTPGVGSIVMGIVYIVLEIMIPIRVEQGTTAIFLQRFDEADAKNSRHHAFRPQVIELEKVDQLIHTWTNWNSAYWNLYSGSLESGRGIE